MTIDEFCERLSAAHRKWFLRGGAIRCWVNSTSHCPISAVTKNPMDFWDAAKAGERLGLSGKDARAIVAAADGYGYPDIRAKLLKAAGLE